MSFRDFVNVGNTQDTELDIIFEKIIIPDIPDIDVNFDVVQDFYKMNKVQIDRELKMINSKGSNNLIFTFEPNNKLYGYYSISKNKIFINLYRAKNHEMLYNTIFHEHIHFIQNKISKGMYKDFFRTENFKGASKQVLMKFQIYNKYEVMAYAASFALFFLNANKTIEEGFITYKENKIFNNYITGKFKNKFKKYLVLYYNTLKKDFTSNIRESIKQEKKNKELETYINEYLGPENHRMLEYYSERK